MKRYCSRLVAVLLVACLVANSASAIPEIGYGSPATFSKSRGTFFTSQALASRALPVLRQIIGIEPSAEFVRSAAATLLHPVHFFGPHDPRGQVEEPEGFRHAGATHLAPSSVPLRDQARAELFHRNDGVDFVTTPAAIFRYGVFDMFKKSPLVTTSQILNDLATRGIHGNRGFWDISMRLLADQGWITRRRPWYGLWLFGELRYHLKPLGDYVMNEPGYLHAYDNSAKFIEGNLNTVEKLERFFAANRPRGPPGDSNISTRDIVTFSARQWDLPLAQSEEELEFRNRVLIHLESPLLNITAFTFQERGVFDLFDRGPVTLEEAVRQLSDSLGEPVDRNQVQAGFDILEHRGWLHQRMNGYVLTLMGQEATDKEEEEPAKRKRPLTAGVPLSYLPLLSQVQTLLTGTPEEVEAVYARDALGHERHVARRINLVGTKAAHNAYFKNIVLWLKEVFDNPNIDDQPQAIADMGCGEGSFLAEAYRYILLHTKRGEMIREHPGDPRYELLMIGADFNEEARLQAEKTLSEARIKILQAVTGEPLEVGIPHAVVFGDINDPDALAEEIRKLGKDPYKIVHTSTFLIHNRPYFDIQGKPSWWSRSVGTFVAPQGKYAKQGYKISNAAIEQNLLEFLRRWKPYLERFGMMTPELHSVPDPITAAWVGRFAGTSYDATHFYSGQYIIELPVFLKVARKAGLKLVDVIRMPDKIPGWQAPSSLMHFTANGPTSHGRGWSTAGRAGTRTAAWIAAIASYVASLRSKLFLHARILRIAA